MCNTIKDKTIVRIGLYQICDVLKWQKNKCFETLLYFNINYNFLNKRGHAESTQVDKKLISWKYLFKM